MTRPTSGLRPDCGASGCSRENRPWWTQPARSMARRPATTRRCAWRRVRWNGWMLRQAQQEGNSNSETSVAFLEQLRRRRGSRLNVIWDNAPAPLRQAQEGREVQGVPADLRSEPEASEPPSPRGQALPGYSPDFNADEATGNLCLGSRTAVQERVWKFLDGRKDEVKRRCRTVLQSRAEAFLRDSQPDFQLTSNAHPTLALV